MIRKTSIIIMIITGTILIFLSFLIGFDLLTLFIGALILLIGIAGCFAYKKEAVKYKSAYSFNVTGTSYHQKDIRELCWENNDYSLSKRELIKQDMIDEPIYKYSVDFAFVSLIPDPDNEYDRNAIKVMHRNTLLGFVPKENTDTVHKILAGPYDVTAEVYAGPYKTVRENEDSDGYVVEKEDQNVGLKITIKY